MNCNVCGSKIDECVFANYKTIIDGKEVYFCCVKCSDKKEKKKRGRPKKK